MPGGMQKGYIHVYTGNGKGKTTAAFGVAIRALCAGKNVAIGQFVKSMQYNETKIAPLFNGSNPLYGRLHIEQFGNGCCLVRDADAADMQSAKRGLEICAEWLQSSCWDVVILDEITIATYLGMLSVDEIIDAIRKRNPSVEVLITGRYADERLMELADIVTEMCEVKHYYTDGVISRNGIDS